MEEYNHDVLFSIEAFCYLLLGIYLAFVATIILFLGVAGFFGFVEARNGRKLTPWQVRCLDANVDVPVRGAPLPMKRRATRAHPEE